MKVAWVFPSDTRDGIALYARRYTDALSSLADVSTIDTHGISRSSPARHPAFAGADVIHVQYDSSFFTAGLFDSYSAVFRHVRTPLVVTLHEVYDQFPDVFPRDRVGGRGLVNKVKLLAYDLRHPAQTCYRRHVAHHFWADRILVHYDFQKDIMKSKGVEGNRIEVLPHPIFPAHRTLAAGKTENAPSQVHLGSTGFINPNYNYELLFDTLRWCAFPWKFTWIGGPRLRDHEALLARIKDRIHEHRWEDRFAITGWVSDEEQSRLLASLDVYLALFKHRSSSGSITTALGARRLIVATRLPLTESLNAGGELMVLCPSDPKETAQCIRDVLEDPRRREDLRVRVDEYVCTHTYAALAPRMLRMYDAIVRLRARSLSTG